MASDQNFSATFKDDLSFSMHVILASFGLLIAKLKALYPYSVPISKIFLIYYYLVWSKYNEPDLVLSAYEKHDRNYF